MRLLENVPGRKSVGKSIHLGIAGSRLRFSLGWGMMGSFFRVLTGAIKRKG